jgi:hypothetical protein
MAAIVGLGEIEPGREGASLATHDDRKHLLVGAQFGHRARRRFDERAIERVEHARAIERKDGDTATALDRQRVTSSHLIPPRNAAS